MSDQCCESLSISGNYFVISCPSYDDYTGKIQVYTKYNSSFNMILEDSGDETYMKYGENV